MLKSILFIIALSLLLGSCGTQGRLTSARAKALAATQAIQADSAMLDTVKQKIENKLQNSSLDTSISNRMKDVINALKSDLEKIEQTVTATELLMKKKSNFNERNYYSSTKEYINRIDSFQAKTEFRDRIYQLLNTAVNINAFHKFELGTFFNAGAYKMPPSAIEKISGAFQPAIDSIIIVSNQFTDLKRSIYIVLVGFADAQPISSGSNLYNELKFFNNSKDLNSLELNLTLSNLRAIELSRNLEMIVRNSASKFAGPNNFKLGYVRYGRGEAFPFNNIIDYRADDERRRVVVFYWSILPDIQSK